MELVFLLTLPGLVVLITILGVIRLIHARVTGKARPGAASIGMDALDTLLRPGSEHRIEHTDQERVLREEQESGEPESPRDTPRSG